MAPDGEKWLVDSTLPLEEGFEEIDQWLSQLSKLSLLGFGEALHGSETILLWRNQLFKHLVNCHGYRSIAMETSYSRAVQINNYIQGGEGTYEEVQETGFGAGLGALEANRDLVEWMREYNTNHPEDVLHFYGFDIPTGSQGIASPRAVLHFALEILEQLDSTAVARRQNIDALHGDDAAWENPLVYMDPSKSIALTPNATELRLATEDLIAELRASGPELIDLTSIRRYKEALHHAHMARELLNFHVALARRRPGQSPALVLGTRDVSMASNLLHIVDCESERGPTLVFAHNSHLQRGRASWPGQPYWGTEDPCEWWPAGAHLTHMLKDQYAVLATALGTSEENGIGTPEPGTLEGIILALKFPLAFLPRLSSSELAKLSTRTGSQLNPTYTPLDPQLAATNFDSLLFVSDSLYQRGGMPLQAWDVPTPAPESTQAENC